MTIRSVLLATTAFMAVAGTGAAAQAQSTATGANAAPPPAAVQEVVVTGSRIPRPNLSSIQPISVISGQEIQQRGFTNLADIINELPAAGLGDNPMGDQDGFDVGRNYINLFNLGTQRTLTLVDGHRFVGDNSTSIFGLEAGNQVDINALPTLFVDRIDEVPATGAAVYGSDAIAGVVNIILKKKFEGVEVTAQTGLSDRGDAPRYEVEAALGHSFLDGKLNLAVDLQYDRTNSLTYADRPRTNAQYAFAPNPADTGPTDGIPGTILIKNNRFSGVTDGGLPFDLNGNLINLPGTNTPVQFAKNGNLVAFNPGTVYGNFLGGDASGGDSLNLAPHTSLQTPLDRKIVTAMGSYDFNPHLRLSVKLFYSENGATENVSQPNYSSFAFNGGYIPPVGTVYPGLAFQVASDNAFLTPQAKAVLAADGVTNFVLSRANTDLTPDPIRSHDRTMDGSIDLAGDFNAIGRNFTWDASYVKGASFSQYHTDNIIFGNPDFNVADRFAYALDSVIGPGGTPVCRVSLQNPGSTNPDIAGCVPVNPFGANNNSKAALKYIETDFGDKSVNRQDDGQINISTSLVKLPAGDLKVALGFEYRREQAGFTPSIASAEGIGYSIPISGQVGAYHTNEYYAEISAPILGPGFNLPFAQKLEFEGAYRKIDNSIAGTNEAWSYGGRFSPIQDLTIRGSRSKTFRAPALTELFAGGTQAYDAGADPCQSSNITSGPNPAARQANCAKAFAALGADLGSFTDSIVSDETIPVTAQGNAQLKNEIGNSWTYGLLVQPRFIPGLSMSIDYIHIDITNAIEFFGVGSLLEECYDSPSYPNSSCGDFTRQQGTGQVTTANETYINAGYIHFAGAQYNLSYARALNRLPFIDKFAFIPSDRDLGQIGLNFDATNTRRLITSPSGLGFDAVDTAGTIDIPRWRWQASVLYAYGPANFRWTTHYIGPSSYDNTFTIENQSILKVGNNVTHDLSASYKIKPWLTARLNIYNITDQKPPFPISGVGYYDEIGRYFLLGLDGKF